MAGGGRLGCVILGGAGMGWHGGGGVGWGREGSGAAVAEGELRKLIRTSSTVIIYHYS